ncbi:MAG: hypothetical protein AAFV53_32165 [Myxococcota bacterium]
MPTDDQGRGPAVVLRQLEGTGREIRLEETTLPERGVAAEAQLRAQMTWYPGAGTASVQLFGTQEQPIVFRGWLRDAWIGEQNGALALAQQLRDMLLSQGLVELSWGFSFRRRGYITRVRPTFDREADIQYEVEFSPTETDEASIIVQDAEALPLPSQASLADVLDVLSDALELAVTAATVTNAIQALF